jgi:hypothetical protein
MTTEQSDKRYCERLLIIGVLCAIVGLVGVAVGLRGQNEAASYKALAVQYQGQAAQAKDALKAYVAKVTKGGK